MQIIQNGYSCEYDIRLFAKMFFSDDEYVLIASNFTHENDIINVYTTIIFENKVVHNDYYFNFKNNITDEKAVKMIYTTSCTKSFCNAAQKLRKVSIPWGVMSGIRPAKIVRKIINSGYSENEAKKIIKEIYAVNDEKIELAVEVANNERSLLSLIDNKSISLYIGIPFCPTRCLYCSFVSTDIRSTGKYMDEYVSLLLKEIEKTAEIINKLGVFVENIYIGGGTPTTLSSQQLTLILNNIKKYIDISKIKEYTLEAGRSDTITREKLITAKNGGINRISINPQTMNEVTLKKVGRTHDVKMVKDSYSMAKEIGFKTINMDLIAGLPDETVDMFKYSLDEVIKLDPENITVHSMCIKRAASLRFTENSLTESEKMNEMLTYTQKRMKETNRSPYYMYRQKNISGNLENVGYSKIGHMSEYNVNIMEEVQTIIALGGGGSTKIVSEGKISRIFNFKDPYEYIRRFDEIISKKDEILKILNKN